MPTGIRLPIHSLAELRQNAMQESREALTSALDRTRRMARILKIVHHASRDLERTPRADHHQISAAASKELLELLGVTYSRKGQPVTSEPVLLVGNHISYLDILLLYAEAHITFLAKAELGSWPFFGRTMRAGGTVFVHRQNSGSRREARLAISQAILRDGKQVVVFPEGTTSLEPKPWRIGAFEVAQAAGFTVQPFRLRYSPARTCAFIGEDALVPHLWKLIRTPGVEASIEFGKPVKIENAEKDSARLATWVNQGAEKP